MRCSARRSLAVLRLYLINQTRRMVAVDINSGKSTRRILHRGNRAQDQYEAAEEIAASSPARVSPASSSPTSSTWEEKRNNRSVERKLKECLAQRPRRIQRRPHQPFRPSGMSRQRLRTGMVEGSTTQCQHCQGNGVVRRTESVALSVLRGLEDWCAPTSPAASTPSPRRVALYILNQKRGI